MSPRAKKSRSYRGLNSGHRIQSPVCYHYTIGPALYAEDRSDLISRFLVPFLSKKRICSLDCSSQSRSLKFLFASASRRLHISRASCITFAKTKKLTPNFNYSLGIAWELVRFIKCSSRNTRSFTRVLLRRHQIFKIQPFKT